MFFDLFPYGAASSRFLLISLSIALVLNVIAELCLCQVLFSWSTKSPDEIERQESEKFHSIETAECDEEFELNARIWNALVTKRLEKMEADKLLLSRASRASRVSSKKALTSSQKSSKSAMSQQPSSVQLHQSTEERLSQDSLW